MKTLEDMKVSLERIEQGLEFVQGYMKAVQEANAQIIEGQDKLLQSHAALEKEMLHQFGLLMTQVLLIAQPPPSLAWTASSTGDYIFYRKCEGRKNERKKQKSKAKR